MSVPTDSEFDALKCIELEEQHYYLRLLLYVPSSSSSNTDGGYNSQQLPFQWADKSYMDSPIAHSPFQLQLLNWNNFMFRHSNDSFQYMKLAISI